MTVALRASPGRLDRDPATLQHRHGLGYRRERAMMTIPLSRPTFWPLPPIAATLALACLLLWLAMPLITLDMTEFLAPWFDHIVASGPIAAFARPFGNYTPAYLYLLAAVAPFAGLIATPVLIKLVTLAGTAAL